MFGFIMVMFKMKEVPAEIVEVFAGYFYAIFYKGRREDE